MPKTRIVPRLGYKTSADIIKSTAIIDVTA